MLKLLRYVFYRAYKFGSSHGRNDPTALVILISMPITLNIFTLLDIFLIITRLELAKRSLIVNIIIITVTLFMYYKLYTYLARKDRIKIIFEEFKNIHKKEKYWMNFWAIIYPVISILLFYYLGNIIRAKEYLEW